MDNNNKPFRIAIDINDTIRDYTRQFDRMYKKFIDPDFEKDYDDINDFDLFNVYPFLNEKGNNDRFLYNQFKYEDYAFELYGRAEVMERNLISKMTMWTQNTLRNFEEGKNPEVMIVSPFEMNLSIQSTLSFLAKFGCRIREIYFPIDSQTIWDRCDLLITANPNLIASVPEGKTVIKINTPYNKTTDCEHSFDMMSEVIDSPLIINMIEKYNDGTSSI